MKELFEFLKPILGKLLAKLVAYFIEKWLSNTPKDEIKAHVAKLIRNTKHVAPENEQEMTAKVNDIIDKVGA